MPCEYDLFPSLANPVVKVAVGSPMVARVYFDRVSPLDLVTFQTIVPRMPWMAHVSSLWSQPSGLRLQTN